MGFMLPGGKQADIFSNFSKKSISIASEKPFCYAREMLNLCDRFEMFEVLFWVNKKSNEMKNSSLLLLFAVLFFASCSDDDDQPTSPNNKLTLNINGLENLSGRATRSPRARPGRPTSTWSCHPRCQATIPPNSSST